MATYQRKIINGTIHELDLAGNPFSDDFSSTDDMPDLYGDIMVYQRTHTLDWEHKVTLLTYRDGHQVEWVHGYDEIPFSYWFMRRVALRKPALPAPKG
jgi:hypothetical protein